MKIGKNVENQKITKPMEREFFHEHLKSKLANIDFLTDKPTICEELIRNSHCEADNE